MKFLLILAVNCLTASASIFDQDDSRINGENGWYIPGLFQWIDKEKAESYLETMDNSESFSFSFNPVNYYLYTKANFKKGIKIKPNSKSIQESGFNATNPTRFIIHGFLQSHWSLLNRIIREAWFSKGEYNIIIVGWPRAISVDYFSSVLAVPKVGKKVASMIDFLVSNCSMSLNDLHVIGHSLGAHVAGYAGKNVKTGQIHTIIGLDPALPLFSYDKPNKRLSSEDAFYVETIQTNGGELGFLKPIGKLAFYPNGGKSQPGCYFDIIGYCSHERSNVYYAEAITKNSFATIKCNNFTNAAANACGTEYSSVLMGADNNCFFPGGEFYVPVNKKPPYGALV